MQFKSLSLLMGIGLAGFVGALSRYLMSGWIQSVFGNRLPYGTLAVNVAGSLFLGIAYAVFVEKSMFSNEVRLILTVGFLGAFTTFSTFSLETYLLAAGGGWWLSFVNISANLILGIFSLVIGLLLGRLI